MDVFARAGALRTSVLLAGSPEVVVLFEVVAGAESEPEGGSSVAGVIELPGAREGAS